MGGSKIQLLDFNAALIAVVDTDTFPNINHPPFGPSAGLRPDLNERVRSLVVGPDQRLYVTTDAGDIFRFTPQ